ncbi:MAG: glycosyltransferase family 87 protein [Anaerolineales bacterium]|jgi:hypothetical protein|nr:glycosyltransferase family 87 protein [Anaerolineales bacterium]
MTERHINQSSKLFSNKNISAGMVGMGVLLMGASFLVDLLGLGKPGLQAAQLSGILVGGLLSLIGLGVQALPDNSKTIWQFIAEKLDATLNLPVLIWVLAGFLVIFISYFVRLLFFDAGRQLSYFVDYIPHLKPIGNDLHYNSSAISLWLRGASPYDLTYHFYPPLYHLVFSPLILFGPEQKYAIMTGLTLTSFGLLFLFPWRAKISNPAIFLFFFLTGLISYGMQFELERGQFNVLALLLAFGSIWLFYKLPSFRYLAYGLLTIAAHIKIYPGIFALMFFSHWQNWKENLKTATLLGFLNLAAFLALGYKIFKQFAQSLLNESGNPLWILPDKQPINHSLSAFLDKLAKNNDNEVSQSFANWLGASISGVEVVLWVIILLSAALILWRTLQKRPNLLHVDVFLLFILLGHLLPSVSIDYKLVLLAPGLALVFANHALPELRWQKLVFIGLVILISAAYSLTLVPYTYRSGIAITAFPMLFTILLGLTGLNLLNRNWEDAL